MNKITIKMFAGLIPASGNFTVSVVTPFVRRSLALPKEALAKLEAKADCAFTPLRRYAPAPIRRCAPAPLLLTLC